MNAAAKKLFRCAIYTRKSTDHNLELEFNSLDAQREACEAYIKSQAHEGWRLIPGHYDDGAFSGASLERPALQKMLAEIRARKIDIVVVYKVDRLTRSLADFAKLVELFDEHSVSFVSVTQSFNTTSSMGRLTLNVLLSFAQFEREVIGERVRDKISASKRKGLWMGGTVPLGYASVKKKLVVIPEEAASIRAIFQRYLELGTVRALAEDLDHRGIRTKPHALANGKSLGGIRFGVGPLAYLLKNRFYVGEVVYRGETHRGEHAPIVEPELFEAVQAKLKGAAVDRQLRLKSSPALLAGRIFDDRQNRMTPTHTNKLGVRFSNRPFRVKRFQTIHHCSVDVAHGLVLLFGIGTRGPSIMGFEDEAEQSIGRPCRQTNGGSKRTCELTSSIVPRGTSFHRSVELECPSIGLDAARFSCCCCGLFSGPAELGAASRSRGSDCRKIEGEIVPRAHTCEQLCVSHSVRLSIRRQAQVKRIEDTGGFRAQL